MAKANPVRELEERLISLEEEVEKYKRLYKKYQKKFYSIETQFDNLQGSITKDVKEAEVLRVENGKLIVETRRLKKENKLLISEKVDIARDLNKILKKL